MPVVGHVAGDRGDLGELTEFAGGALQVRRAARPARAPSLVLLELLTRAQAEDQRTQLVQRLARKLPEPFDLGPGRLRVALELRRRRLSRERQAEEPLADDVVKLEREAVPLGDDRQLAALLVQPRVGGGDRGVGGEQLDQLLVLGVEGRSAVLLGQVERR